MDEFLDLWDDRATVDELDELGPAVDDWLDAEYEARFELAEEDEVW